MRIPRLFIGSQADLYLAKWRSDSHWNWAAFCFDGYWLLYRGMYLYFLLYVLFASVVVNVLGALFFKTIILERLLTGDNLITILCFYLLLKIIMGIIGNQLYLSHVKRKIASMYYRFPRDFEMREEKIATAGETSLFVPIALAALPLLLAAVVALISAVIAFKSVGQYTPPGLIYGVFQRYI
ncbi:DUF2628 domain-containing protein [Paenibacillus sp. CAA11]|uniref:DUF2628 domain-containing protein n=1 Tax=Paenibacillus sp. CAA11 TaxID=1532905 RepID=UPI001F179255|nr:DUF2628 domain-containing protein [Paenibacillus sp. CAA11]